MLSPLPAKADVLNSATTNSQQKTNFGGLWDFLASLLGTSGDPADARTALGVAAIPSGVLADFAGSAAPSGWLLCYGQAVSRTTYAALFAAIGTAFGVGDGSTTFNLPDLRGRASFGKDNMGGSAANRLTNAVSGVTGTTLGAAGGDEHMHGHAHTITDAGHAHDTQWTAYTATNNGSNIVASSQWAGSPTGYGTNSITTGISINASGAGAAQNVPPALVLNKIIKT